MLDDVRQRLDDVVQEDAGTGHYRCKRNIFTDAVLFEMEMKHMFEGNWIYMAHESQIPNKDDYFTTFMGRQPNKPSNSSTAKRARSTTNRGDDWLAHYAPDAVFWIPSWDDDDLLVENPLTDISLIYYGHKGGLEDRVFRIRTERSSATSLPEPRTSDNISNVEITEQDGATCKVRFNWFTLN